MKLFNLITDNGIIVAEGVAFTNGQCAVNWLHIRDYKKISGMAFYDCEAHIMEIHGNNGKLKIKYLNTNSEVKSKYTRECYTEIADEMCNFCTCWKMTRKNCS